MREPDWIKRIISPHILSIPPYVAGKPIAELTREMGISDAIKMASNENPLGPSPLALRAIQEHLSEAHIYPESSAPDLRQALAKRSGLSPDCIIIGNGSDEIMEMAAHVFIGPGDEAIMGENAFSMYRICAEAFGGQAVRIPLKNYAYNLPAMAKAITEKTKLIFIAIPNNPTGTIVSRANLKSFLDDVRGKKLVVVIDEAYREYVRDLDCPNGLDYIGCEVPVLILRTFSKIYGLAGLRVGYGMAEAWLIELLNRVRAPFNANSIGQVAALAALEDHEHIQRSLEITVTGMQYLEHELKDLGFEVVPSQANFLCFCGSRNAKYIYEALLKKGVIVRHLASFGMENCIRVTIGKQPENERFIKSMREVVKEIGWTST